MNWWHRLVLVVMFWMVLLVPKHDAKILSSWFDAMICLSFMFVVMPKEN